MRECGGVRKLALNIERLTQNDLSALSELFRQFRGENTSMDIMHVTYSKISKNPSYLLLAAKQSDHLVGFAMGIFCEEIYGDCKPFMVIEDLIVDKNQRRHGIGAELMRELEQCAIDHDCYQIIFITESDRIEALKFYRALGYEFEPYKGFKKRIGTRRI
jgi:ribosomal protein S18 acetylase RimI-like enzyme